MRNIKRLAGFLATVFLLVLGGLELARYIELIERSAHASSVQSARPVICGTASALAQTASITTTTLCTAPVTGLYRLSYYFVVTTTSVAGTLTATLGWTDASAARTVASNAVLTTATGFSNNAIARPGTVIAEVTAGQLITWEIALTAVTGNPEYAIWVSAELLQ